VRSRNLLIAAFFGCMIIGLAHSPAFAGNILTDDQDIMRVDITGGLASPSPGITGGGSVLWTKYRANAVGIAAAYSRHELVADNATLSQIYLDFVWEHSVPLWDGYYGLRVRGASGLARSHRAMDRNAAEVSGEKASRIGWGLHLASAISFDFPLADLIWGRIGLDIQKNFSPKNPTLTAIVGGVAWGGQWFGIGD
jgi:hypothetical protein